MPSDSLNSKFAAAPFPRPVGGSHWKIMPPKKNTGQFMLDPVQCVVYGTAVLVRLKLTVAYLVARWAGVENVKEDEYWMSDSVMTGLLVHEIWLGGGRGGHTDAAEGEVTRRRKERNVMSCDMIGGCKRKLSCNKRMTLTASISL